MGLTDRRNERDALDRLIEAVQTGHSRALVVRGDSGVVKTMLDYLAGQARGCRVARAAGLQSEIKLVFAWLYQLCAPMLSRAEGLPKPRRAALAVALGVSSGRCWTRRWPGRSTPAVRDLLVAESRGNPLALPEHPRKVFAKLGVSSRHEPHAAPARAGRPAVLAAAGIGGITAAGIGAN